MMTLGSLYILLERILDENPNRHTMPVTITAPHGRLRYGIESIEVSSLDDFSARLVLGPSEPISEIPTIEEPS